MQDYGDGRHVTLVVVVNFTPHCSCFDIIIIIIIY